MKKIAVFFPGIGYTVDKPLMYYSRHMASAYGYEIRLLPYGGFPDKVKGDRSKMEESFGLALEQSKMMLADLDFADYEEILFVGKSVGTIVAAAVAAQSTEKDRIRRILYTPLEDTFTFPLGDSVVFTGLGDPWVGKENSRIPGLCGEQKIPCHVYPGANHSLETGNVRVDLDNLREIMRETEKFICNSLGES